jgi:microcystin-dependent protein
MAEIRIMSFGFPPKGWAECNGQLLPINQNQALFSLLGTFYGGDGRINFALPDLRGRVAVHNGGPGQFVNGTRLGEETHTLSQAEMPQHFHIVVADSTTAPTTTGNVPGGTKRLAGSQGGNLYAPASNLTPFNGTEVGNAGGGQAHENRQPYLTLEFCIALQGIFPSRN